MPLPTPPAAADPACERLCVCVCVLKIQHNLIGNSCKFTRKGCILLRAEYRPAAKLVEVTVADSGIGIPEDKFEHIFLAFEQVGRGEAFELMFLAFEQVGMPAVQCLSLFPACSSG